MDSFGNSEEPDEGADETLCLDMFRATRGDFDARVLGKHSTDLDPLLPACEPCAPKQVKVADEQVKVDDPFGGAEVDMEVDSSLSPSGAWFDPREASAPPQAPKAPNYLGSPCTDEGDSTPAAVAGSDTEFAGSDASSEDEAAEAAEAAREDANV